MIPISTVAPAGMLILAVLLWPRSDGPAIRDGRRIRALDSTQARARRRETKIRESLSRRSQVAKAQAKARSAGLLVSGMVVLLAQAASAVLIGIAAYSYTGNLPAGAIMALAGWQIPSLVLEAAAAPKKRAYAGQVEGLLLSTSLSASQEPLIAVLRRITENTAAPLQTDLRHLIATVEEGKPIGLALEEWGLLLHSIWHDHSGEGRQRPHRISPRTLARIGPAIPFPGGGVEWRQCRFRCG